MIAFEILVFLIISLSTPNQDARDEYISYCYDESVNKKWCQVSICTCAVGDLTLDSVIGVMSNGKKVIDEYDEYIF